MVMLAMRQIHTIEMDEDAVAYIQYNNGSEILKATLLPEDLLDSWLNYDEVTGELLSYSLEYKGIMFDWRFTYYF